MRAVPSDPSSTTLCTQKLLRVIAGAGILGPEIWPLTTLPLKRLLNATYVNVSAQETFDQKDNRFNVNCIGQGTFDSMSLEDADQATFDSIFYVEDYPAWH